MFLYARYPGAKHTPWSGTIVRHVQINESFFHPGEFDLLVKADSDGSVYTVVVNEGTYGQCQDNEKVTIYDGNPEAC